MNFFSEEGGVLLKNWYKNWKPTFFIGAGADKKKTDRFRNTGFDLDGVAACWYGDCGGGSQQAGWQDPPLHDPLLRDVRA